MNGKNERKESGKEGWRQEGRSKLKRIEEGRVSREVGAWRWYINVELLMGLQL